MYSLLHPALKKASSLSLVPSLTVADGCGSDRVGSSSSSSSIVVVAVVVVMIYI